MWGVNGFACWFLWIVLRMQPLSKMLQHSQAGGSAMRNIRNSQSQQVAEIAAKVSEMNAMLARMRRSNIGLDGEYLDYTDTVRKLRDLAKQASDCATEWLVLDTQICDSGVAV